MIGWVFNFWLYMTMIFNPPAAKGMQDAGAILVEWVGGGLPTEQMPQWMADILKGGV